LICDDEPNIRESIHYVVVKAGFDAVLAVDGVEAYTKARDLNPDLLLLDVGMPGMTGFDVCERLRADAVFNAMKIVILTSYGQLSDQRKAAEVGADRFIVKPFSPRHLKQLLCDMLG
ncbi:MAG TPA: response regulator, partial [Candidatus Tenderia electrophaga]|nr:response regulator [Candidatus Tenderia electrophaga]